MTFEERVAAAKVRVEYMDKADGFRDRFLGTIWQALEAGLRRPASGCQYEAFVMLSDLRELYGNQPLLTKRT